MCPHVGHKQPNLFIHLFAFILLLSFVGTDIEADYVYKHVLLYVYNMYSV